MWIWGQRQVCCHVPHTVWCSGCARPSMAGVRVHGLVLMEGCARSGSAGVQCMALTGRCATREKDESGGGYG